MHSKPLAALALFVAASACNSLLGIDGDFRPAGEGGSGGSATGTNTGTGLGPGPGAGPPAGLGEVCANDEGCAEGVCGVDGVCCTEACDGICESCIGEETGDANGQCAPLLDGTDECNGPDTCVQGQCGLKPDGLDCGASNECINACGPDGVCCDNACGGPCESCVETVTGMPQGTCAPIPTGMTGGCDPGEVCDGMGACKKNDGVPCTLNPPDNCLSGHCVDGVCCDTACDQLCEACTVAISGEPDGICSPVPAGMNPGMECGAMTCDGAGMCQ